ncbi:MAG: two-component system, NtrC family, nitrogen regulation sensor histidine kinase NtrY [Bacteroidales bacterium]|nr:two-component system, NtrC family, nitrogen regulation sensor histidine kinase NtrY [Bacteroidales bacterium]
MNIIRNKYFLAFLVSLCIAIIFNFNIRNRANETKELKDFQAKVSSKLEKTEQYLDLLTEEIKTRSFKDLMASADLVPPNFFEQEGVVFLGYVNDTLQYWSDNLVPVENIKPPKKMFNNLVQLDNGWYISKHKQVDDFKIFGLLLIKNQYSYSNNFIHNDFHASYDLSSDFEITDNPDDGYAINDNDGNYLFSLTLNSNLGYQNTYINLAFVFYLFALLFFFGFTSSLIVKIRSPLKRRMVIFLVSGILIGIRFLMLTYKFPSVFNHLELFQPHQFAISWLIPSLGDLLLHAVILLFIIWLAYKETTIKFSQSKFSKYVYLIISILITYGFFLLEHFLFKSLILHSSISFDVYQFFDLSIYSLIGFVIIVLLSFSLFLLIDCFARNLQNHFSIKSIAIFFFPFIIFLSLFLPFLDFKFEIFSIVFFAFFYFFIVYIRIKKRVFSYAIKMFLLLLFAVYTVTFITIVSRQKDRETRKVLVVNLANEHDQVAEMLLESLETEILKDTVIRDLLTWHIQNEGAILEYLQMNYFSGYFRKYDLQISVCNPNDELTVNYENSTEIVHCYSFFEDLIKIEGNKLKGSNFYFLDNLNGRISYFGKLVYNKPEWNSEVSLFIALDSKLISQELGYPELLLDQKMSRSSILANYSYAKYKDNQLITRSGEYSYQLTCPKEWMSNKEFYFTSDNNFEHLIYKIDDETSIVISDTKVTFIDTLASFSYIFVFYYILYTLSFFIIRFPHNVQNFRYDFKNKIKVSMIGLLFLSLILVGSGTLVYNFKQFERNLYESIGEKLQSVLVEMEHKLGGEYELDEDYTDYLTYLLNKFSSVFYIDINLYDTNGNLLASSRPQIFEKGLMGKKMNVDAYRSMVIQKMGKYIHKEHIGELTYYSAYVPFVNDNNELLAYLNLPYFTKQSALRKEIFTIVVAVVNIYFFLILLSIIIAIFVSNNITKPLQLIQERFRAIDLGKKNEPIQYESQDEIGSLIKEYNRMVSELTENAEKLAKSERESAWREMAKQIAHEIKNPLTPMKLSVQYLQKAWKEKNPDFDQRIERFSNSLISQINNLSKIATEFSNFAKMPRAKAQKVNIIQKLEESISLFEGIHNVNFNTQYNKDHELYVYADLEQVLIVFSNLIQNAIQAIPNERKGIITINVEQIPEFVKITIEDNGVGIPEELKEKLFRPNFTTKSSGMGLGLAIVKNIVENSGGSIGYDTQMNIGTSFYVTFPAFKPE